MHAIKMLTAAVKHKYIKSYTTSIYYPFSVVIGQCKLKPHAWDVKEQMYVASVYLQYTFIIPGILNCSIKMLFPHKQLTGGFYSNWFHGKAKILNLEIK